MSAPTIPTCPLGLTADDLSAWRDEALPPGKRARIAAHARSCPACQRTIAAHDALSAALQAERPPAPDPRNWPALQARIASGRASPRASGQPVYLRPARRLVTRPALWGGLSAVAAVIIVITLFFSLFQQQAAQRRVETKPLATPAPVSTLAPAVPVKGAPLTWRSASAPATAVPPLGNQELENGFSFAPSDARTAYICAAPNAGGANPVTIWATHNGAQSWTKVATVANTDQISQCAITVDTLNPLRLNLFLSGQNMATLNNDGASYISEDGGQTWRALSKGVQLEGLTTRGQTSIAVADAWWRYGQTSTPISELVVSRDGFHTWEPIDQPLTSRNLVVTNVWQRPGDGALLAMTIPLERPATPTVGSNTTPNNAVFPSDYQLWESADMGARWSEFPTPANLHNFPGFIVAQPRASDPWRVCGLSYLGTPGNLEGELVACTLDGGQTWTSRPLPATGATSCPSCAQSQIIMPPLAVLLDTGELVTEMFPTSGNLPSSVVTLAPGASVWNDLGPLPGGAFIAVNAPAGATLISYTGGSFLNPYAGSFVGHIGGDIPDRGGLSFATLP